jgi:hypothetical protein
MVLLSSRGAHRSFSHTRTPSPRCGGSIVPGRLELACARFSRQEQGRGRALSNGTVDVDHSRGRRREALRARARRAVRWERSRCKRVPHVARPDIRGRAERKPSCRGMSIRASSSAHTRTCSSGRSDARQRVRGDVESEDAADRSNQGTSRFDCGHDDVGDLGIDDGLLLGRGKDAVS